MTEKRRQNVLWKDRKEKDWKGREWNGLKKGRKVGESTVAGRFHSEACFCYQTE